MGILRVLNGQGDGVRSRRRRDHRHAAVGGRISAFVYLENNRWFRDVAGEPEECGDDIFLRTAHALRASPAYAWLPRERLDTDRLLRRFIIVLTGRLRYRGVESRDLLVTVYRNDMEPTVHVVYRSQAYIRDVNVYVLVEDFSGYVEQIADDLAREMLTPDEPSGLG